MTPHLRRAAFPTRRGAPVHPPDPYHQRDAVELSIFMLVTVRLDQDPHDPW